MSYIWNLDPTAFSLMGLEVRWYGLAYVAGFLLAVHLGWWCWQKYQAPHTDTHIEKKALENFVFSTFLVGVISARIGLFVFYYPETLINDPLQFFKVWQGGMSIHGGLIGATLWGLWQGRKLGWPLLRVADTFMLPLALGLFLGRLANFVNGELYGRVTDQTWGVVFPHVDNLLRHPSQLYEASKNLFLAGLIYTLIRRGGFEKPGLMTVIMIGGYGVFRFMIEFVREPSGYIGWFTTGQALCLAMIAVAIGLAIKQPWWPKLRK